MKLIFKECIVSYWYVLLLACVPQFDTMHPSVTLGAFFNDRIFTNSFLKLQINMTYRWLAILFEQNF